MIDQIKNKSINTSVSNNKNNAKNVDISKVRVEKVDHTNPTKIDAYDGKVSQFITKEKIKSMSKEPPIDRVATTRIKEAIKDGTYPLDLTKIADALLDAYKEMK